MLHSGRPCRVSEGLRPARRGRGRAPLPLPLLKAIVTRLVRRIAPWKVCPRRPGPKTPEDAVQHVSWISLRTSPTSSGALPCRLGNACANRLPPLVREVHLRRYKHLRSRIERGCSTMEQARALAGSQGCRMRSRRPCSGTGCARALRGRAPGAGRTSRRRRRTPRRASPS